ncbi:transposase (plasmid) [Azospirillum sp. B510]|nr:transposase [Azospirillum sp. B510]
MIRRRGPWRTLEAVEFATLEWVDWFNHRRLLEPIGNIPPAEAEARYYAQIEDVAIAACSSQMASDKPGAVQSGGLFLESIVHGFAAQGSICRNRHNIDPASSPFPR